tara:strand:+ start:88 stop:375 length:288 start_codon:yes stop_codon:yes gene_type:complete
MGEIADAMIWGEMTGHSMDDPEDWIAYYKATAPVEPNWIAFEAQDILDMIQQHGEGEITVPELLEELFPEMNRGQALAVAMGLEILASFYKEDEL